VIVETGSGSLPVGGHLLQEQLAEYTTVCTYARAGYGWSEPGPLPRHGGRIADELHELLHRAGVEPPCVLVGHSMGGLYVRVFADRYPNEVAGLVLVDPSHPDQLSPFVRAFGPRVAISQLAMLAALAVMPVGIVRHLVERGGLGPVRHEPRPRSATHRCRDALIPVSAEHADRARQLWRALREDLLNLSSNSTHVRAPDSGHFIYQDRPDPVLDAIKSTVTAARDRREA
jgi:pimeloyl-ACP methyl ester carboxylesterase